MAAVVEVMSGTARELGKTLRLLSRNKIGFAGLLVTLLVVFMSLAGPLIWPPEQSANVADINQGPSQKHWLGTDFQGQDNLLKVISGGKEIVIIAFLAGTLTTLLAVSVGAFSAFIGGWVDGLLMEVVNVWLTIPKLPLLAILATMLKLNDVWLLAVILALIQWPGLARQVRSQILTLKKRDYVEAATMLNLGTGNIIFREMLPNMMSFITIALIFEMTHAIYQQTSLVFLGLVPFSGANWGVMIELAQRKGALFAPAAAWSLLAPSLAIILFQLALVSFARSLDEVFNPRLRTSV
ncbi:MAG: ABC transporter permease [Chloroflexi bacterium]|nr:ABC transporter permease [Chloroflexota bacterium]